LLEFLKKKFSFSKKKLFEKFKNLKIFTFQKKKKIYAKATNKLQGMVERKMIP
jgi:hypothetical protein